MTSANRGGIGVGEEVPAEDDRWAHVGNDTRECPEPVQVRAVDEVQLRDARGDVVVERRARCKGADLDVDAAWSVA
mgnify:CR=1 FL=1